MEKTYKLPSVVWLKVTNYMHGWLQHELGGEARIGGQRVICVAHLNGARDVMRRETVSDMMAPKSVGNSMSSTRRNCLVAGMEIDADTVERMYGMTRESLKWFVPVECPKFCMTKNGVLRPWGHSVCFSREQANALLRLLRDAFWNAVQEFASDYARQHSDEKYAQADMIEAFCQWTGTPDVYAEAMRREWQRRCKRN